MNIRAKSITSAVSLALLGAFVNPSFAEEEGKVTIKLSGQVNRALLWADDGINSDLLHVDNDNSSTRFRFLGSASLSEDHTVGITWENEFESNTSSSAQIDQNSDGSSAFKERKLEAWHKGPWGKLSIGQGDGAANGTSESDLSGTSVVNYSGIADVAGGIAFKSSGGADIGSIDPLTGAPTQVRVKDVFNNFDGLSRNDRLRYDTPAFGPFGLAASITNGDAIELAARVAMEWDNGNDFEAAVGVIDGGDRVAFDQVGASASFKHSSGLNITFAWGQRDIESDGEDPTNHYVKLGWRAGAHNLSVDYGSTEDLKSEGDEATTYAASWVWKITKSAEVYAIYRVHELDRPGVDVEDIQAIMAGTRIKFF